MDAELKQALAGLEARFIQHFDERLETIDTKLESFLHHVDERLGSTETKILTWFHDRALTDDGRGRDNPGTQQGGGKP